MSVIGITFALVFIFVWQAASEVADPVSTCYQERDGHDPSYGQKGRQI